MNRCLVNSHAFKAEKQLNNISIVIHFCFRFAEAKSNLEQSTNTSLFQRSKSNLDSHQSNIISSQSNISSSKSNISSSSSNISSSQSNISSSHTNLSFSQSNSSQHIQSFQSSSTESISRNGSKSSESSRSRQEAPENTPSAGKAEGVFKKPAPVSGEKDRSKEARDSVDKGYLTDSDLDHNSLFESLPSSDFIKVKI